MTSHCLSEPIVKGCPFCGGRLIEMISAARDVGVSEPVADYAFAVVEATRRHDSIELGVSPRAAMSWLHAARARALVLGRDYVLPDDLKILAASVLGHRVFLKGGGDARTLVEEIVEATIVGL